MSHTISDVSARGMCVGCGACSVATGGRIPLTLSPYGMHQVDLINSSIADREKADKVCPFSDAASNEDQLGTPTKWGNQLKHDPRVGHYSSVWSGKKMASDSEIETSSSGGLTSWLAQELLNTGEVDGILHVGSGNNGSSHYIESRHHNQISSNRKSRYTSTTLGEVLLDIHGNGLRYAIVGLPCMIKAARLLAEQDPVLAKQLVIYIGLVCGHLKSAFFGQSLAWQLGVDPSKIAELDFRVKNPDRGASEYDFGVRADGENEFRLARPDSLIGGNWGHAAFQPEACNFCDDIFAETADVVFGDAWLPEFSKDWRGTNIVVSRNALVDSLLSRGAIDSRLDLNPLSIEKVYQTQAGNVRHRRVGLQVRLKDDIDLGLSVPQKRVQPSHVGVSRTRIKLLRFRRNMSQQSFAFFSQALKTNDLQQYLAPFSEMVSEYRGIYQPTLIGKAINKARKAFRITAHMLKQVKHQLLKIRKQLRRHMIHIQDVLFSSYDRAFPFKSSPDVLNRLGINTHHIFVDSHESPRMVPNKVFVIWSGRNALSPNRKHGLESIKKCNPRSELFLVTPDNLHQFVVPEHPLHPAFELLSYTHRSDYLRAYLLHHHGGAYLDIKEAKEELLPYINIINKDPNIWLMGFPERSNTTGGAMRGRLGWEVRLRFRSLAIHGLLIARPQSPLTQHWLEEIEKRMSALHNQLKLFPGPIYKDKHPYPVQWTYLGSQVLQPLQLKYLPHVSLDERLALKLEGHR